MHIQFRNKHYFPIEVYLMLTKSQMKQKYASSTNSWAY